MRPLFLFASSFPFSIFFLSLDFASNPWKCSTQKSMQGKTRHKNKSNAVMLMLNAPSVDGNQREEKRRSGEKQKKNSSACLFLHFHLPNGERQRKKKEQHGICGDKRNRRKSWQKIRPMEWATHKKVNTHTQMAEHSSSCSHSCCANAEENVWPMPRVPQS